MRATEASMVEVTCPGCGLVTPDLSGESHPYIGASRGCWERYGELLATGRGGQLAVDTYAAQHPGVEERRSIQSVAVHLMGICAVLERGAHPADGVALLRRALEGPHGWHWLEVRRPVGTMTVSDVLEAEGRGVVVRRWALSVWSAYAAHHETIREWLDRVR